MTYKNGNKYIGNYIKGQKGGVGKWISSSGIIYEGSFANGLKNGQVAITYPNGKKEKGIFKDDQLIKKF
jgi:hypothetical protein